MCAAGRPDREDRIKLGNDSENPSAIGEGVRRGA
jgi:hypothetical protein